MSDTVIKPPFTKETALAKVKAALRPTNLRSCCRKRKPVSSGAYSMK
jgi:nuclear transport factor 2 (NTF2) superfamily protein